MYQFSLKLKEGNNNYNQYIFIISSWVVFRGSERYKYLCLNFSQDHQIWVDSFVESDKSVQT